MSACASRCNTSARTRMPAEIATRVKRPFLYRSVLIVVNCSSHMEKTLGKPHWLSLDRVPSRPRRGRHNSRLLARSLRVQSGPRGKDEATAPSVSGGGAEEAQAAQARQDERRRLGHRRDAGVSRRDALAGGVLVGPTLDRGV